MKEKRQTLTYSEALWTFFQGIQGLSRQLLPFRCIRCNSSMFTKKERDKKLGVKAIIWLPIMSVDDCFRHIRRDHQIKLKHD